MKLKDIIKSEFDNFGKYEKIFFSLIVFSVFIVSILAKGSKISLISAVCGISYTILAGKGKVSCYYIGITGTLCYSYLAFINAFFANFALYTFYYLPMQIIGIFKWKKHLKKDVNEIQKTYLNKKEKIIYFVISIILSIILTLVLANIGDENPAFDSLTTVLSILGLFLTVKRCIEQWYIWFIVNSLSFIMWLNSFLKGADCLPTVLMWFVYIILSIYFLFNWKKDIKQG